MLCGSVDEKHPISSLFPQPFLCSNFLPTVSSFHNVFSSTCWYYVVLGHALKLNSNNVLTALVLSSLLTWPHLCNVALETLWTILCSNLYSKNLISNSQDSMFLQNISNHLPNYLRVITLWMKYQHRFQELKTKFCVCVSEHSVLLVCHYNMILADKFVLLPTHSSVY